MLSLVHLSKYLVGIIDPTIMAILTTMQEIQELLYNEEKDSASSMHVFFKHGCLLKQHFQLLKSMTKRRFYGQYYHGIVKHAPN